MSKQFYPNVMKRFPQNTKRNMVTLIEPSRPFQGKPKLPKNMSEKITKSRTYSAFTCRSSHGRVIQTWIGAGKFSW